MIRAQLFGPHFGAVEYEGGGVSATISGQTVRGGLAGPNGLIRSPFNAIFPDGLSTSISPYAPDWGANLMYSDGAVGVAYLDQFDLVGIASPTTYSLISGTLPPGLALTAVGGNVGKLSGTPTTAGVYTFTVRASNAFGVADKSFTVTIAVPGGGSSGGGFGWVN